MGEVVRKKAAVDVILADVRTTVTRATARGGDWQADAEARLGSIVTLADAADARVQEAEAAAAPVLAELDAANEEGDAVVGKTSDDVWNDVGRPGAGADPHFVIMFPGGIDEYTDVAVDEQPYRMEFLAGLLEGGIHPRLDPTKATEYATRVRQAATRLEEKVDAARPLRARLELAKRMQTAIARSGAVALGRLKKKWLSDGRSEAEIHSVIPDRPRRSGHRGATAG
jgi:hypothetical protein